MSFASPGRIAATALPALATCLALGAVALGVHGGPDARAVPEPRESSATGPASPPGAGGRAVVVVATEPNGSTSEIFAVPIGEKSLPHPIASVRHGKGATVRGALLGDGRVALVADADGPRPEAFGATLLVVDPAGSVHELVGGAVHASAPLVTARGALLVSRGDARSTAPDGTALLGIDRVDAHEGTVKRIFEMRGNLLFLAGSIDDRVLVYAIDELGRASLVEVPEGGGSPRPLVEALPPFARDFIVDPATRTLVFVDRAEEDSRRWEVLSLDLDSGFVEPIASTESMLVVPARMPDGALALYDAKSARERTLDGDEVALPVPGVLRIVRGATDEGATTIAGLVTEPGRFGQPIAFAGGAPLPVPAPEGRRITVLGTIALGGGAR